MKTLLIAGLLFNLQFKTVVKIDSCASSGRCRVFFDDKTTDLLFNPYIGMKVKKGA